MTFWSESSYLSDGIKELGFSSVYQDHVLLLRSPIELVDQSHTPVFEYFRCSLFSTISEPWVMMMSMLPPHF